MHKGNCKIRPETFRFWNLVCLYYRFDHILKIYYVSPSRNVESFSPWNPSRNDAYMHQWIMPLLVQIMAHCLFGAKPSSDPKLANCHTRKWFWKCHLQNSSLFISALMWKTGLSFYRVMKYKSTLGRVTPLGWPRSVSKSDVEHSFLKFWVKMAKWP